MKMRQKAKKETKWKGSRSRLSTMTTTAEDKLVAYPDVSEREKAP